MANTRNKWAVTFNAPAVLVFSLIAVAALVVNFFTAGAANRLFFSVYRAPMSDPLTYLRFAGHAFGHANVQHLVGNLMIILLLGPSIERRYGSSRIVLVMVTTALVTGIVHFIFLPGTALLGASGIAFSFIILSSLVGFRNKEIPVTFILVTILYLGEQIYGLFTKDSVSQLTHILGGVIGAVYGFIWKAGKTSAR
ncbi:MAG: rhomboid family intramembrane serine protease [Lachnospiraceae bacterium]|nr:rhomboid family intramembrane serine protease [Lachnospiraceae bacterium]